MEVMVLAILCSKLQSFVQKHHWILQKLNTWFRMLRTENQFFMQESDVIQIVKNDKKIRLFQSSKLQLVRSFKNKIRQAYKAAYLNLNTFTSNCSPTHSIFQDVKQKDIFCNLYTSLFDGWRSMCVQLNICLDIIMHWDIALDQNGPPWARLISTYP